MNFLHVEYHICIPAKGRENKIYVQIREGIVSKVGESKTFYLMRKREIDYKITYVNKQNKH